MANTSFLPEDYVEKKLQQRTNAICLVLFLAFNYVLVATARLHATVARALLHAPEDPLREAKEVLSRPGPLNEFSPGEFIPYGP